MERRIYRHQYARRCLHCERDFNAGSKAARYCCVTCRSLAASGRRLRTTAGNWLRTPITCRCGKTFYRTLEHGPNQKHCSLECSGIARGADYRRFVADNPGAMSAYNRHRVAKYGRDTLITRLRKRYPNLPAICEAEQCAEGRVLEIAHKPEHKRNGAWRTMDRYEREMFWMLCPTHHRLIDVGIIAPAALGLV